METYLVVGNGRVAQHLRHYFELAGVSYCTWFRPKHLPGLSTPQDFATQKSELDLVSAIQKSSRILLAISDQAIEEFYRKYQSVLQGKVCVHFSGALVTEVAQSAHPLTTFAETAIDHSSYDLERYRKIPFVTEKGRLRFNEIFPDLQNPSFEILPEQKPLYHALCVLAGNFSILLWEKAFTDFQTKLGLPPEALASFLEQTFRNLAIHTQANLNSTDVFDVAKTLQKKTVLTGPLVRGDQITIHKNLVALTGDPYQEVYESFIHAFEKSR